MKKRFIAGSRCPQCHAEDSLRTWQHNNMKFMDCIHCDYRQSLDNNNQKSSKLIGIKTLNDD